MTWVIRINEQRRALLMLKKRDSPVISWLPKEGWRNQTMDIFILGQKSNQVTNICQTGWARNQCRVLAKRLTWSEQKSSQLLDGTARCYFLSNVGRT